MTQFLRDQASDREEVVTPLMLDGTYLSRNYATLGPMIRRVSPTNCQGIHIRYEYEDNTPLVRE